jgi:hypothetical protein
VRWTRAADLKADFPIDRSSWKFKRSGLVR